MTDRIDGLTVSIGLDTGPFKTDLANLKKASEGFGSSLTGAFSRAVFDGKKLSDDTIRHELEGNLCRCTGYHNIVKAIKAGAKKM